MNKRLRSAAAGPVTNVASAGRCFPKDARRWWRLAFQPEVTFAFSAVSCVYVWVYWILHGKSAFYNYSPNQYALLIWVFGYVSFFIGCRIAPRLGTGRPQPPPVGVINIAAHWWMVLVSLQLMFAIRAYGGIPLFQFLRGQVTIADVNASQENARFGQLGLFTASLFCATYFVTIASIIRERDGRSLVLHRIYYGIIVLASAMAGKRQGVVVCMIMGLCIVAYAAADPRRFISALAGIRGSTVIGKIALVGAIMGAIIFTQIIEPLRNGVFEVNFSPVLYFELPQINFHYQTEISGFGPFEHFRASGPLLTLLPRRLWEGFMDQYNMPVRLELSSPSGFWENIQWFWGLPGVIGFAFVAGMFCKAMARAADRSVVALGVFALIPWALLSGAAYNHFLNPVFLWAPGVMIAATFGIARVLPARSM